jgi:hypothetical protein
MNLPEASQDAILGRANLSIVTWKGISGQMGICVDFPSISEISFGSAVGFAFWLTANC